MLGDPGGSENSDTTVLSRPTASNFRHDRQFAALDQTRSSAKMYAFVSVPDMLDP